MEDTDEEVHGLVSDLQQQRDELKLQLHLLKAEARDEWVELEKKWNHVEGMVNLVGREAGGAARDVGEALALVAEELKAGYARIRGVL